MYLDIVIIILIAIAIYYLKINSGAAEIANPVAGFQAFTGLGG